jgi:hypothetical protein
MRVKKENAMNDGDKSVNTLEEGSDLTDIQHDEIENDSNNINDRVSDDGCIDLLHKRDA